MLIQCDEKDRDAIRLRFAELLGVENAGFATGEQIWPLPNMVEVTMADLYWHRSTYRFKAEAHILQFKHEPVDLADKSNLFGHPRWSNAFIYLVDRGPLEGGGFVVVWTYNRMDYNHRPVAEYADALGSKSADAPCIQVYRWRVCEHKFQSETVGNCVTRYKCEKCGASHTVDSSD